MVGCIGSKELGARSEERAIELSTYWPGTVKLREGSLTALPCSSGAGAPGAAPRAWARLRRYAGGPPHQCEGRAEAAGGGDGHPS